MMGTTALKDRVVVEMHGLSIVDIPTYIPTDMTSLLTPTDVLSTKEINPALQAIWHTGEASDIMTLKTCRETSGAPSPSHAHILRSIHTRCEAELLGLDKEILRLYNTIADLSQQLAKVSAERIQKRYLSGICSSFLSPIRKLPLEILGEIFSHCVSSHHPPCITEAPLSLSHVCSAWRRAVFAFPRLWNNLILITASSNVYEPYQTYSASNGIEVMKFWFDHSQNCPLTLEYGDRHQFPYERKTTAEAIDRTIVLYAHRFQKLHLHSDSIYNLREFLTLPPGNVNWLNSLNLGFVDSRQPDYTVSVFREAPLLRELTLHLRANSLPNWDLPWAQLTSIMMAESPILTKELLLLLRKCRDLVHAFFFIKSNSDDHYDINEPHTLENLTNLNLTLRETVDSFGFLNGLSFPALTTLILNGDHKARPIIRPLLNFLYRIRRLQCLTLECFSSTPDDILLVLKSTPYLTRLHLDLGLSDRQYDRLIQVLTYVQGQRRPCVPFLEQLDLYLAVHYKNFHFAEHEFVAMVQSRQAYIDSESSPASQVAFLYVCLHVFSSRSLFSPYMRVIERAQDAGEIDIEVHNNDPQLCCEWSPRWTRR